MQTKLFALVLLGCVFIGESWVPAGTVATVSRRYDVSRPSIRRFSVSIQDPNDMNNDCNNDSQLSPTDLNKQQQDSYIGFPGSSNTLIRWNDTLQSLVVGVLGATLLYQLILHQQHHARGWDFSEIALRDFADTWTSYMGHLQTNPILTKAITSGTVYTIGDVIAQRTEQQRNNGANGNISLDGMRVLRSSLAGLIGHGPLSHAWYNVCDYSFENILHLSAAWWPLKILIDQTVWGPIWNNTYIVMLGLMKRETLEAIWSDMKRTTVPLIVSGLKLWPLAHCVTYGLIPKENRVLWVDMVEIVWVTILATQAAGHTQATLEAEEQHAKGKNT